jgi:group I intron endonuclease
LKPEYNICTTAGSTLGKLHSEKTKAKMAEARVGLNHSKETKAKMAEARVGLKHSKETKAKIAEARVGLNHSKETKAKMAAAKLGIQRSEETKAKIKAYQSTRLKNPVPGRKVEVSDILTGETTIYDSTRSAAKGLDTNHTTIRNYIKSKKLYRDRFKVNLFI